jgi:choline-glycine betaine transporter
MKLTTRILMGIIFPFILIITVSSISKALKTENPKASKGVSVKLPPKANQQSTKTMATTLVD